MLFAFCVVSAGIAGAAGGGAISVWRSTAVGEVSGGFDGGAASDFCLVSAGGVASGAGAVTLDLSAAGGALSPLSRKFIARRKPLNTISTTLTPTSSGRVRDGFAASLDDRAVRMLSPALVAAERAASAAAVSRLDLSVLAAAAAWAARRAAAMKFDLLEPSPDAGAASVGSEPAKRSVADFAWLRAPGSSG